VFKVIEPLSNEGELAKMADFCQLHKAYDDLAIEKFEHAR
jgi:hypothetical protein